MIKFLRTWCEGIMICIFVALIIEMLVPNGNIKKYVRVIIGIYIIFMILNPIISNLDNFDANNILSDNQNYSLENTARNEKKIAGVYEKAIETEIKENCNGVEGVEVVFSKDLKNIESIEIVVSSQTDISNIKKYIMENYKVSDNVISIIS